MTVERHTLGNTCKPRKHLSDTPVSLAHVSQGNDDQSRKIDDAPAVPLRNLVGMLDEEAADRARERSHEWREAFDELTIETY